MRRALVVAGICLIVAFSVSWIVFVNLSNPSSETLEVRNTADVVEFGAEVDGWARGPFTRLLGGHIRAELDRYLMLELHEDLSPEAEEALRAKLTAFLRAYAGTDFARYLEFRPREQMCALSDPRLKSALAAWSAQLGPVPTETAGFMETAWRMYVAEGMGPARPGAVIDAVNWRSCRAIVHRLEERNVVLAEWDEMSPGESHLRQSLGTTSREAVMLRVAVPNAVSATELVKRDGGILWADFDLACRARDAPARRLVLRFVWDCDGQDWLPLHAAVFGGSPEKPFVW